MARARARIALGLSPVTSRKVRPNVPKLSQPVSKAMSVMGKSVSRSSAVARSMRRVSRYRCGGTPKACLNDRAKWASETPLTRARRRTGQSSCEAASIRSFARSRRRNSSGSWRVGPPLMPPPDARSDTIEPPGGSLPHPEMACIHAASRCSHWSRQLSSPGCGRRSAELRLPGDGGTDWRSFASEAKARPRITRISRIRFRQGVRWDPYPWHPWLKALTLGQSRLATYPSAGIRRSAWIRRPSRGWRPPA